MAIHYDLSPEQRGLLSQDDMSGYTFPGDHITRLWQAISEVDPEFFEDFDAFI